MMIALLLYLVGLVSALVTLVIIGFDARAIYFDLLTAYNVGANTGTGVQLVVAALGRISASYQWALMPFLGGLLLMGFARIMVLLGAINRALRHPV
jgi:hypothetical protein